MRPSMVRKAKPSDVPAIHHLVHFYAQKGDLLPRTLEELYQRVRDFHVFDHGEQIAGVCSLFMYGPDLAEIRSLAVQPEFEGKGIGRAVTEACLSEARGILIKRVFALTYTPVFFERLGFRIVKKIELPEKIWKDCLKCSKFFHCDEVAVLLEL